MRCCTLLFFLTFTYKWINHADAFCVNHPWSPSSVSLKDTYILGILEMFDIDSISSCDDFEQEPRLCDLIGGDLLGLSKQFVSEACCICGGKLQLYGIYCIFMIFLKMKLRHSFLNILIPTTH